MIIFYFVKATRIKPKKNNFYLFKKKERNKINCIYIFDDEFLNIPQFRKSYEDQAQGKQFLFI